MSTQIARLAWTQAMMTHRFTSEAHSKALYQRACDLAKLRYSDEDYTKMVSDVSEHFTAYASLDIRRAQDEYTGRSIVAIVNTEGDTISQGATTYTAQELSYIKRIIRAIFTSSDEAYSIFATRALGECNKIKPTMTKKAAEELLNHLVSRGWLIYDEETGAYSLSTRACLELQTYLKAEYEDFVLTCTYCSAMVTRGAACATEDCPVRYHHHCVSKIPRQGGVKCPDCKAPWVSVPVGRESMGSGRKPTAEGLFSDDEEEATQTQTHGRRSKSRHPSRASDDDEEEEDAEEIGQEEERNQLDELDEFGDVSRRSATQATRKSGRSSTGRANAKRRKQMENAENEADEDMEE